MYDHDHVATPAEAVAEFARNAGVDHPDRQWLLHDWDVWVRNPHYVGPPQPHPEDDEPWDTDGGMVENEGQENERRYDRLATEAYGGEPEPFEIDDDMPF